MDTERCIAEHEHGRHCPEDHHCVSIAAHLALVEAVRTVANLPHASRPHKEYFAFEALRDALKAVDAKTEK
jgi:hypothetical protein